MAEDGGGPGGGPVGFAGEEVGPNPGAGFFVEEVFVDEVVESGLAEVGEGAAHPIAHGEGEAHFGAVPDLLGEEVLGGGEEEAFRQAGVEFFLCGVGEHGFDEGVVEEGDAEFDGVGHAHGVRVAQQGVAHVVGDFAP